MQTRSGKIESEIALYDIAYLNKLESVSLWQKPVALWRRANAQNVRLYYPYRQYTNLFIFRLEFSRHQQACRYASVYNNVIGDRFKKFIIEDLEKGESRSHFPSVVCYEIEFPLTKYLEIPVPIFNISQSLKSPFPVMEMSKSQFPFHPSSPSY